MENPTKALVNELATTENFFMIKELVKLFPQVCYQHNSKIFRDNFQLSDLSTSYKYIDATLERLEIGDLSCSGDKFFRFAIYIGDADSNWYFGVVGPWPQYRDRPEVKDLESECQKLDMALKWNFWYSVNFKSQRSVVYDNLANNNHWC